MSGCCDPSGYRRVFSAEQATKAVRRFERRGLDGTARAMVAALGQGGLSGRTMIEVGAGPGTALVTLLEGGVDRAEAYDISPAYEAVAGALLQGRGLADRVDWHTGDFVAAAGAGTADIVFLNRVVCCYSASEALLEAATRRSRRLLALSYPRRRWSARLGVRIINALLAVRRVPFRVFVHDPGAMARQIGAAGFVPLAGGRSAMWEWRVWERG